MRAVFRSLSAHPIQLAVLAAVVIGLVSVLFQVNTVYRSAWHAAQKAAQASVEMMRDPAQRAIYELNSQLGQNIVQSLVNTGAAQRALLLDERGRTFASAARPAASTTPRAAAAAATA